MSRDAVPEDRVFHAVADATRRAMLDRLASGEQTVSELAQPFAISQPAVSQHLSVLRRAGLVRARRAGRRRVYRIRPRALARIREWAEHFAAQPGGGPWGVVPVRPLGRVLEFRGPRTAASPITRVRAVALFVRDMDGALDFYRDGLGLQVRRDENARDGPRRVELGPAGGETAVEVSEVAGGRAADDVPSLVLSCRDLLAARQYLTERGIAVLAAAESDEDGRRALRLRDPEGRALLLVEER